MIATGSSANATIAVWTTMMVATVQPMRNSAPPRRVR
jgi:hypothetical protein